MRRPSERWRALMRAAAQPAQPLPDLCPTSQAAPLCGLPNLLNLFAFRAYRTFPSALFAVVLCVRKQVGQVGQVGQSKAQRGFALPNLAHVRLGRLGRAVSVATCRLTIARVLPSQCACGLHGRNNALVGGFELWFNRGRCGSGLRFKGEVA
jgi:hypothetical protein